MIPRAWTHAEGGGLSNTPATAAARWSSTDLAVAGAIAVLAALVRANALHGALVWDDHLVVTAIGREGGFSLGMLLRPAQDVPGFRGQSVSHLRRATAHGMQKLERSSPLQHGGIRSRGRPGDM